jgi:hypothetical protein
MAVTNKPEDLLSLIRDLQRQVKELRRGTLSNAVVSQGSIEVRTAAGQVLFRAGEIPWGGTTKTGTATYRVDGSMSTVAWDDAGGNGYWAVLDEAGNIVASSDTVSGVGLALPYLQFRAMPYSEVLSPPQSTTSGTFTPLHRIHGQRQQPYIRVQLITQSDAATTGEVRLTVGGVAISSVLEIPASDNFYRVLDAPLGGAHLDFVYVDVEARRVSGAGAIRVGVAFTSGRQS